MGPVHHVFEPVKLFPFDHTLNALHLIDSRVHNFTSVSVLADSQIEFYLVLVELSLGEKSGMVDRVVVG
jgi:hypothetical protein